MTLRLRRFLALCAAVLLAALPAVAEAPAPLPRAAIEPHIVPPFALGPALDDQGLYSLLNSGGAEAGYVFETAPVAPLPGFSGAPVNVLVTLDLEGRFLDVRLLSHNEPIFVSGLGEAPFHGFFEQYRGLSISDSLVVGSPYGSGAAGSELTYLDGVTKATASVRIAHESVMAAALKVARERMQGVASGPPVRPAADDGTDYSWDALVEAGLVGHLRMTNAEVDALFADSIWSHDDPEAWAEPEAPYLDLWLIDLAPPAIARAVLAPRTLADLDRLRAISPDDAPLLVIDTARHGLVSEEFVRNTAPDRLTAAQDGFPVALRDADLFVRLADGVPDALQDGTAMVVRTDRRLGFDPTRDWQLEAQIIREHGMFQPQIGSRAASLSYRTPEAFYDRPEPARVLPPWQEAIVNRQTDLMVLAAGLTALVLALSAWTPQLAAARHYRLARFAVLAAVIGFVGWWGQGQLSIVTVLATLTAAVQGGSFAFLLYDPFSLMVWGVAILGFVAWGRGFFCGWLCPFGAMQEFAHALGRALRLPRIEPSARWDARLKGVKYVLLAGLVATVFLAPSQIDRVAEVEPFKTAVTTYFVREWYYVAYAAAWLVLGTVLFKGFCRYVCPLGAVMAIGGLVRGPDWIARRAECGSPCQLCRVKCQYGAIDRSGQVAYSECFQCLDCVTIFESDKTCVPQVLARRRASRGVDVPDLGQVAAE